MIYRLVRTDISKPSDPSTWANVIPPHEKDLLQWASALKVALLSSIFCSQFHLAVDPFKLQTELLTQSRHTDKMIRN